MGLFEVAAELRRTGVGRRIVTALLAAAKGAGMDSVRLACLKNNEGGRAFWDAMGFAVIRDSVTGDERRDPVWILERRV